MMRSLCDTTVRSAAVNAAPYPGQTAPLEEYTFTFSPAVRKSFRSPKRVPTASWMENHYRVFGGSRPGPWSHANLPYAPGIFDVWDRPHIREMVFCFAPQCGKTSLELGCLASAIDQDPGPVLFVMDTEKNAKDMSKDQLKPMVTSTPRLAAYLGQASADTSTYRIDMAHMTIYLGWATSVSALASKPIRYMFWDEIDKHESPSRKEADAISLGEKRQRTFRHSKKTIFASTPSVETGPIWQRLHKCAMVCKFWARCPSCGGYQILSFAQIKIPDEVRDIRRIENERLARYACEHCEALWDDFSRDKAVRLGEWRTTEGRTMSEVMAGRPESAGFHLSALYSPFVSLSEIMAAFLVAHRESELGNKDKLKDVMNGYLAEPWVDHVVERTTDRIFALCDGRRRGDVPIAARVLLASVDTQDASLVYEIRAWGEELESWQIREGEVEGFAALAQILFNSRYRDAQGRQHAVHMAVIDLQGHRTAEVYDFCRQHRNVLPVQGAQRMSQPWKMGRVEFYPGTSRPIPGGLKIWTLHTTFYKDWLSRKMHILPTDPGAWHLHSEVSDGYALQLCAEFRDARGLWMCPKHKANHYWDVAVYGLFLADFLGVRHWPEAYEGQAQSQAPATSPGHTPFDPSRFRMAGRRGGR